MLLEKLMGMSSEKFISEPFSQFFFMITEIIKSKLVSLNSEKSDKLQTGLIRIF